MDGQMSLFDFAPQEADRSISSRLKIVKAKFINEEETDWRDLFEGYNEIYGITFSSGIAFMEKVLDMFDHAEMVFGCEGLVNDDYAAIMSMQTKTVELISKNKSAVKMAQNIDEGRLQLYVSRDTRSHEKIFILHADDGRTRVITGSANMSASAFCGFQREDIVCFDDAGAYEYYKDRFEDFKQKCADNISEKVILNVNDDQDYLRDNIEEVPINRVLEDKKLIVLEPDDHDTEETAIIADIRGLEDEMKPLIPKSMKNSSKIMLTGEAFKGLKRNHKEQLNNKKITSKKLPKLHLDYDTGILLFNNKPLNMFPSKDDIITDMKCLKSYMSSLASFHGEWEQGQKDYFLFMNWFFASIFMPYLRVVAYKNNYDLTPFPVFGIIYGESNGGKSTFIKLLSKLMCGHKIPLNSSSDFTASNIENLKRACEGLPINIDDLAKPQYENNYEKVIKDDNWGIAESFVNYPAVTVTTNKLPSIKPDVSKRTVTCFIGLRLDKDTGAKNSKKINESIRQAGNALFSEYVRRMFGEVLNMADNMKNGDNEYFPDIFELSSGILCDIYNEYDHKLPQYMGILTYSDYFGDRAVGKNAMAKILKAWENDRKWFKVNKKKNTLSYEFPDNTRSYELKYIQQELPPALNAQVVGSTLIMDLDKARNIFGVAFKKHNGIIG